MKDSIEVGSRAVKKAPGQKLQSAGEQPTVASQHAASLIGGQSKDPSTLLDTHVALWWALDDAQMSARHRQLLETGAGEFYISTVSCWETSIKAAQGKLRLDREEAVGSCSPPGINFLERPAVWAEQGVVCFKR